MGCEKRYCHLHFHQMYVLCWWTMYVAIQMPSPKEGKELIGYFQIFFFSGSFGLFGCIRGKLCMKTIIWTREPKPPPSCLIESPAENTWMNANNWTICVHTCMYVHICQFVHLSPTCRKARGQKRGPPGIQTRDLSHHKALSTYSTPLRGRCLGSDLMPIWGPLLWRNQT